MDNGFDPVSYIMGQRSIDPNAEYYTKAEVDVLLAQKQNTLHYATGTITTNTNITTINYSGNFINAYATQGDNLVQCNITINNNNVVFSLKDNPSSQVVCTVCYG